MRSAGFKQLDFPRTVEFQFWFGPLEIWKVWEMKVLLPVPLSFVGNIVFKTSKLFEILDQAKERGLEWHRLVELNWLSKFEDRHYSPLFPGISILSVTRGR